MKTRGPRIIVIGAGIVGASIAYHLACHDAAVTLIDKGRAGAEVTSKSFGWINVSHGFPEPYLQLHHLAIKEYRRLENDLGYVLPIKWCGALILNRNPDVTERFAREHAAWGYDVRLVGRDEIAALEPYLIDPPAIAAFAANEGAVEPTATTELLVDVAQQAGATIRLATEVTALTANGRSISGILTSDGAIEADVVVVAAGTQTSVLCRQIGLTLPINASPALLLRFKSPRRLGQRSDARAAPSR